MLATNVKSITNIYFHINKTLALNPKLKNKRKKSQNHLLTEQLEEHKIF